MDRKIFFRGMAVLVGLLTSASLLFLANLASALPGYQVHKLASDILGFADNYDPNLKNPWGIAASPTSQYGKPSK